MCFARCCLGASGCICRACSGAGHDNCNDEKKGVSIAARDKRMAARREKATAKAAAKAAARHKVIPAD